MQQCILLAAVETVDLVDEQNGARAVERQALFCRVDFTAQIRHRAADSGNFHERRFRCFRDNVRDRCFPRSGRAVQNNRADVVLFDGRAQPAARAHGVGLPHHIFKRTRAHAHRQRRDLLFPLVFHCRE